MNCIKIERLALSIGETKNEEGQQYLVDVSLHCDISALGRSDSLEDTVGYSKVCQFLKRFMEERRFCLLETLAEKTARALLQEFPKVYAVDLTLRKQNPLSAFETEAVAVEVHKEWNRVYLSLHSNVGDKEENLNRAIDSFYDDEHCRITAVSNFIESETNAQEENFLNGCIEIETLYAPKELFEKVYKTEVELGDTGSTKVVKMDILLYRSEIIHEQGLMIPHTQFHKRLTVLEPLSQIAPYAIHPIYKKTISQLLEELQGGQKSAGGCQGCSGCVMMQKK